MPGSWFAARLAVMGHGMPAQVAFHGSTLHVADPRVFRRGNDRFIHDLAAELAGLPGLASARFDLDAGSCAIAWGAGHAGLAHAAESFVDAVAAALNRAADRVDRTMHEAAPATLVRGPKRVLYAFAGGGCIVLTLVGAVVPGIPTVPFLLGASYFLARSSRTMHAGLLATPLFGRVVRELDTHRGMTRRSKLLLAGCTSAVVVTTLVLTGPDAILVVTVAAVLSLSLAGIARIPAIDEAAAERLANPAATGLLLPGPWARGS